MYGVTDLCERIGHDLTALRDRAVWSGYRCERCGKVWREKGDG